MAKKATKKPKRLVRGKDWAWTWEFGEQEKEERPLSNWQPGDLYTWTQGHLKPKSRLSKHGHWVRVKLVKV